MRIEKGDIISIIREVEEKDIIPIVDVLLEEGIDTIEVSLSNEEMGLSCLEEISKHYGDIVKLGVGTVINITQVEKAIQSGAKYIITPGWDRELVREIKKRGLYQIPGVFTPSEVMQSILEGIEYVKLFPANALGTGYIKDLFGPFPNIKIIAVGGINKNNILDFYNIGIHAFAIGSDIVPRQSTKEDLDKIRKNAKEYISIMNRWM